MWINGRRRISEADSSQGTSLGPLYGHPIIGNRQQGRVCERLSSPEALSWPTRGLEMGVSRSKAMEVAGFIVVHALQTTSSALDRLKPPPHAAALVSAYKS